VLAFNNNEIIENLWQNGTGGVNDELLKRYAGGFDKAVRQVFKDNSELADNLRINAATFGTFKTYDLCRELDAARQSGMALEDFNKFAKARISVYNGFQKTEYNTLISRCRTAKQFGKFQKDADLYPNLEWLATRSATPRLEHEKYAGLILPIDDPFWNSNQPGNEYNCKCDWRQTNKPSTAKPEKIMPPAKGLEGNPAKTSELVTERHPYFTRNADAPAWVSDKAILQLPDEVAFVQKTTENGQMYLEHRLVGKTHEAKDNRMFAALLLENGYTNVKLLPQIEKGEKILRERYFGIEYARTHLTSNPDAMINNDIVEFKFSNNANLSINIGKAAKKSSIAVVKLKTQVSDIHIDDVVKRQWKMNNRKNLNKIIIINDGKLRTFERP
jgi:hypothetical protein